MLTGQTTSGTYGAPFVIGGPTDGGTLPAASNWDNIVPVIDGLTIVVPLNPTMIGLDFRSCANASVESATPTCRSTPSRTSPPPPPTHSWATGLFMPIELNNDEAFMGEVCVYGAYYGTAIYAHTSAQTIKSICCGGYGMFIGGNGNDKHGLSVNYASLEACGTALQCDGNSGITIPVNIGLLDVEAVGSFTGFGANQVQDPNKGLGGRIGICDNTASQRRPGRSCPSTAAGTARPSWHPSRAAPSPPLRCPPPPRTW